MITLADAKRVLAAAERKAEEIGQPMNIAVVEYLSRYFLAPASTFMRP